MYIHLIWYLYLLFKYSTVCLSLVMFMNVFLYIWWCINHVLIDQLIFINSAIVLNAFWPWYIYKWFLTCKSFYVNNLKSNCNKKYVGIELLAQSVNSFPVMGSASQYLHAGCSLCWGKCFLVCAWMWLFWSCATCCLLQLVLFEWRKSVGTVNKSITM